MELLTKTCPTCGGQMQRIADKTYKCCACKNEFLDVDKKTDGKIISEGDIHSAPSKGGMQTKTFIRQKLDDLQHTDFKSIIPFSKKESDVGKKVSCTSQRDAGMSVKLVNVEIPAGTTEISSGAFEDCIYLEHVSIPDSVISIEKNAFKGCKKLKSLSLPKSVTHIGESAFQNCISLTSLVIPSSTAIIEAGVLEGCLNLEDISIPFVGITKEHTEAQSKRWLDRGYSSMTHFGVIFGAHDHVEQNKKIPSRLISVLITGGYEICENAFWGCSHIQKITIADSITFIGQNAFFECSMLKNAIFLKTDGWRYGGGQTTVNIKRRTVWGDLLTAFVPNEIMVDSGLAAKALKKTYRKYNLVSK